MSPVTLHLQQLHGDDLNGMQLCNAIMLLVKNRRIVIGYWS